MDWIVLGDDWGRHPSTTQHLVRALPVEDRVVWVDSLGMRSPRLTAADARRITGKLGAQMQLTSPPLFPTSMSRRRFRHVKPLVLPFHQNFAAVRINRGLLGHLVARAAAELDMQDPVALVANPAGVLYLDSMKIRRSVYLRLDDYAAIPGVDPALIRSVEPLMFDRADLVVGSNPALIVGLRGLSRYLPQGVDVAHFERVPLTPPKSRVVGYYGSIASWLDFRLIVAIANHMQDWTFEFVGPVANDLVLPQLPDNVRLLGPSAYGQLPDRMVNWQAAWSPFKRTPQIEACNPLKIREYLAAGLPFASTPYPAAAAMGEHVTMVTDPIEFSRWLRLVVDQDDAAARQVRRQSQTGQGWSGRADAVRGWVRDAA
ncbi:MAG: hypothetical protein ACI9MR_000746 [Myxococcota bacterium]|jgi:hypothetical protein